VRPDARARQQQRRSLGVAPEQLHGKLSGYTGYGCRCEPCKAAESAYTRSRKARRPSPLSRELSPEETAPGVVWRPVIDFEGLYEVSNVGSVRSLDRVVMQGRYPRRCQGQLLHPSTDHENRKWVHVKNSGVGKRCKVARLVLEAFVGPAPDGMECCHNDGDSQNNQLTNLRWDTKSANAQDVLRHGTHWQMRKTRCKRNHPFDSENTIIDSKGHRQCRTCRRRRHQERRLRNRLTEAA
jgi:hypothetical protein